MVLTILPAGSGDHLRPLMRSHGAGLLAGSLTMALVLALAGAAVSALGADARTAVVAAVAVAALLWVLNPVLGVRRGLPWPRSPWQVPEQWRYTMPLPVTLFAFGYLLGLGVLTNAVFPVLWVFIGLTVALGDLALALAAWAVYAATRWAMTVRATRRWDRAGVLPDDPHGAAEFRLARVMTFLALAATAVLAGATLAT